MDEQKETHREDSGFSVGSVEAAKVDVDETNSASKGNAGKSKTPELKADVAASLEFLQKWRPGGPWALTGIIPDGGTQTRTFDEEHLDTLREWLASCKGKRNVYFSVNPVLRAIDNKAKKEDIAAMEWLHLDIDARTKEDIEEEKQRAMRLLKEFAPPPTVIVDSGNGVQAFWKLRPDDKLITNGDIAKAEQLEAYNMQLEKLFEGDHCHNIDRIMRLPGMPNLPNARKIKKGRVACLASLVEWHDDRVYPLSDFTAAVRVQAPELGLSSKPKVKVSGNIARLNDVQELSEWGITNHTMCLIVQAEDPTDPTKYPSRSEVLFRVCCDMVRAEVPDEVIFSVITDANFGIGRSVLDKPNSERYALRQIERAKEEVINPVLRKLNEKHAVIADMGGKCRIISEVWDDAMHRHRLTRQSFDDFRNRYCHIKVTFGTNKDGNPIEKPAGKFWIEHPLRRQFENIVFAPGKEVEDAYNLWKGFACDAVPGDKHESFLTHIRENVCCGSEEFYDYLVRWMARAVQQPDCPGETAVVLRGKRGTGKSFFAKRFGELFGRHFLQVSNSQHLVGNFNSHLRDAVVVFGDEAFYAGDKRHESVLKTLITEESIIIEGKGVDAEASPNFTHVILASNNEWVVPAGAEERRFFVLDVGDGRMQDHAYFEGIARDLASGGKENLLYFLETLDISGWQVRRVPTTNALKDQKARSMSPEARALNEILTAGFTPEPDSAKPDRFSAGIIRADTFRDLRNRLAPPGTPQMTTQLASRWLKEYCVPGPPHKFNLFERYDEAGNVQLHFEWHTDWGRKPTPIRPNWLELKPLSELRAIYAEQYGSEFPEQAKWLRKHHDAEEESGVKPPF